MYAGVGFSNNPDTQSAGYEAVLAAMRQADSYTRCDMIILFATAHHDGVHLRQAVSTAAGDDVLIVGGGAVGTISNNLFGYAGDQVSLAMLWFENTGCKLFVEGGLDGDEYEVGQKLGSKLKKGGIKEDSATLLFYDSINISRVDAPMVMATYFLDGIKDGLGYLPNIMGAGLQGDYINTPTFQWTGQGTDKSSAMMLSFSDDIQIDHTIMHGCRPATGYYTVTKADKQTILEINGEPALDFMNKTLNYALDERSYPFFLILGVNHGEKWGEFDEKSYASRLCLAIDVERRGLVMFEPTLTEGTEFQIMFRSLSHDYMIPRIEALFKEIEHKRRPVLGLYIDCAGRAAGYGGLDMEDAVIVQNTVAGRVPLLGIYSGVEIASVEGTSRGLDWTGVFCLISEPIKK